MEMEEGQALFLNAQEIIIDFQSSIIDNSDIKLDEYIKGYQQLCL